MKNSIVSRLLCTIALFAMPIVMAYSQDGNETKTYIGSFDVKGIDELSSEEYARMKLDEENGVFSVVEQMPEFPGGIDALMEYISTNVKYPVVAQENGVQGRVVVSFVVEKDGSVDEVEVVKSVDPYLDRESVRVVSNMPKWKPGKQDGEAVKVKYNLPISFDLGIDEKLYERYYKLSNQYEDIENYANAIYYCEKAIDLCDNNSTSLEYFTQNIFLHYELWTSQVCTEEQTQELLDRINDFTQQVEELVTSMTATSNNEDKSEKTNEAMSAVNEFLIDWIVLRAPLKYFLGDINGAIEDFTKCIDSNLEDSGVNSSLYRSRGYCYRHLGQKKLADKDFKDVIKIEDSPEKYDNSNFAYFFLGNTKKAIAITDVILSRSTDLSEDYYSAATLYALMGNKEKALEYLEKAFEEGYIHFGWIHWDDQLNSIRETPEFKSLVNKYEERYEDRISLLPKIE